MGDPVRKPVTFGAFAHDSLGLAGVFDVGVLDEDDDRIGQVNGHQGDKSSQRIGFVSLPNDERDG